MDLLLIPGAWSTAASFNFLISVFAKHPNVERIHTFGYDAQNDRFPDIVDRLRQTVSKLDNEVVLVGHSLGGVAALAIGTDKRVAGTMTLASPIAGLRLNKLVEIYLTHQAPILNDIMENSNPIKELHKGKYTKPVTVMVATNGYNPIIFEPNDGVVTVASQINWMPKNSRTRSISTSHHEILQAPETAVELGRLLYK